MGRVVLRRPDRVALLRRQAAAAVVAGRPVAWLALVLYGLQLYAPKGRSATTGRVAALMAVTADFGSGRRARPGRVLSAEVLNCSERTIERHWRLLEGLGVAVLTVAGTQLSPDRRAEVDADPDERTRWRDRQEWHLVLPAWASDLTPETGPDLVACEQRAVELLEELTRAVHHPKPRRGCTAARTQPAVPAPVDNRPPGRPPAGSRVAPSRSGVCGFYVQDLQWFSQKPQKRRPSAGRAGGAATRLSSTRGRTGPGSGRRGCQMPAEARQLAAGVLARPGMGWLHRAPRPMLVALLRPHADAGWTPRDITAAVDARLAAAGVSPPARPDRPVAYLRWLLADVDLSQPPAQTRAAAVAAARVDQATRTSQARAEAAAALEEAVRARGSRAHQTTRKISRAAAARAAARRARARAAEAAELAAAAEHARAPRPAPISTPRPAPAPVPVDPACVGGCGTLSADVVIRPAVPRPLPYCSPCWQSVRRIMR